MPGRVQPLVFLACLALAATPAVAQWRDATTGEPLPETDWTRTVDGIGISLLLTDDLEGFMDEWYGTGRDHVPSLRGIERVRRGESVGIAFLFALGPGFEGEFVPRVRYLIYKPDGSLYEDLPEVSAWSGDRPETGVTHLSRALSKITIEPDDPLGVYEVKVTFKRDEKAKPLLLRRSFEVVAGSERIDSAALMQNFYRDPDPALVASVIEDVGRNGYLEKRETFSPAMGFFLEVFHRYPDQHDQWRELAGQQPEMTQRALFMTLGIAPRAKQFIVGQPPDPGLNDVCWGAFFASGDTDYLDLLISRLAHMDEREDLLVFLTASTAKWSLAANARRHAVIREHVESVLDGAEKQLADRLQEILERPVNLIQRENQKILEEGQTNGSWKTP